jgi:transcription elongation factor GreA
MSALPATTVTEQGLMTAVGYAQLCSELNALRTTGRREMTKHLREVRADRDPDNPLLFELLEEQAQLEERIGLLEAQTAAARIVTPAANGMAGIGSRVRVRQADNGEVVEYDLVGPTESDVANGRVSVRAPVGRGLVGRTRGAVVAVETPRGPVRLEILDVSTAEPAAKVEEKWSSPRSTS